MADMNGVAFGLGQMGAALGNRVLDERDRDRSIATQDRAFSLQQNQDARAKQVTDANLLQVQRRNDAEDIALQTGGNQGGQGGSSIPASYSFDVGLHPDDDPAQKEAMTLAEQSANGTHGAAFGTSPSPMVTGTSGAASAHSAGAPAATKSAQTGKSKFNFLQNAQATMDGANALLAQARSQEEEMTKRLATNPFGDSTDPANRKAQLWADGISRHYGAEIQTALQGAQQKKADAETLHFGNYSAAAAGAIRAGNPAKAVEYLMATGMAPEAANMYGNLTWDKKSERWMGPTGYTMTDEALSATIEARDPESIRKSLEHATTYAAKLKEIDKDIDNSKRSTSAAFRPDPKSQAVQDISQWTNEYQTKLANGADPNSQDMRRLEYLVGDTKKAFGMASAETRADAVAQKPGIEGQKLAGRVLAAHDLATMGGALTPGDVAEMKQRANGQPASGGVAGGPRAFGGSTPTAPSAPTGPQARTYSKSDVTETAKSSGKTEAQVIAALKAKGYKEQ